MSACDQCDLKCSSASELRKHKKGKHGELGGSRVTCDDCGTSLYDKCTLAKHKAGGNCFGGKRKYTKRTHCSFCALTFSSPEECSGHRRTHKNGKLWKCLEEGCEKSFDMPRKLRTHMKKHRGEFNHTCEECGKKLITKQGYDIHMRVHKGEYSYSCEDCGKKFVTDKYFKQHRLSHIPPSFACEQCGKMYIDKPRLKRHMKSHLLDENGQRVERKVEEMMCHLCSTVIYTKWGKEALAKHIKKKHLGVYTVYSYKCDNCGYVTDSNNQLKAHQASSRCDPSKTLNKAFICPKCKKGFTTEKSLQKHEQEHITGKPFKCDTCGIGFTERFNLNKHLKKGVCKSKDYPLNFRDNFT
jgi:KRAB domain-containing zinc finger protein